MKILWSVFLVSCVTIKPIILEKELSVEQEAARMGYFWAANCVRQAGIPFDSIKIVYVPGKAFIFTDDSLKLPFVGYTRKEQHSILIAEEQKDDPSLYAHEFTHYLSGVMDHPDSLFTKCGLR